MSMTETFLNGKFTVTSLAAPTDEDNAKLDALPLGERRQVLAEALAHGRASGIGDLTREEIWNLAIARAGLLQGHKSGAL